MGLEVTGISKMFGPLAALADVSIAVAPGQFHALLGENGAGKSTLVRCIMGVHPPTRGQLRVGGRAASFRNLGEARAAGIGMVHQHFTLSLIHI